MPEKNPQDRRVNSLLVKLYSLAGVIFVLALMGFWLDQEFHTVPLWTAIGAGLGVLYSFYAAWRVYKEE